MTRFHDSDPAKHADAYLAAFNAGDAAVLDSLYTDDAVLVPQPGQPLTGAARVAASEYLLGFGLPINATTRHAYVAGDIALLIVDWSIHGKTADGHQVDMRGSATDVVRRDADGRWRYVIDNPFGTA